MYTILSVAEISLAIFFFSLISEKIKVGFWIKEHLTFAILWKFNPIWLFFLLSGRCLLPKYYFSQFNCSSRPLIYDMFSNFYNTYVLDNAIKSKEK